jgi:hypothetical protein
MKIMRIIKYITILLKMDINELKVDDLSNIQDTKYLINRLIKCHDSIDKLKNQVIASEAHLMAEQIKLKYTFDFLNKIKIKCKSQEEELEILKKSGVEQKKYERDFRRFIELKKKMDKDEERKLDELDDDLLDDNPSLKTIKQKKYQKKPIPKAIREEVWKQTIGNTLDGKCFVCGDKVYFKNFDCSHILAEKNGGKAEVDNLKVCCQTCNRSCGVMNLMDFKNAFNKKK